MTMDTPRFREWLERDSFWHSLSKPAVGILQGLHNNLPQDAKFFQWLDLMRDTYHQFMFHEDSKSWRSLRSQIKKEDVLQKASRRMIYRYV